MISIERKAYYNARARCKYRKDRKNYRDRGIQFRFTSFTQWMKALGTCPSPRYTVDRIDNDGHYEPGNVRWATRSEQQINRRPDSAYTRRKKSIAAKKSWRKNPTTISRACRVAAKKTWTPERRKKHGQAARRRLKRLWSNPAWRKRQLNALRQARKA